MRVLAIFRIAVTDTQFVLEQAKCLMLGISGFMRNSPICDAMIRYTDETAISVDMMFQMLHSMGFENHFHEVRQVMYLVEAGSSSHRFTIELLLLEFLERPTSPGQCLWCDERALAAPLREITAVVPGRNLKA